MRRNWIYALGALWSYAEGTLFFLVPDIFLSMVGPQTKRDYFRILLSLLLGATLAVLTMYSWGAANSSGVRAALVSVPAVSNQMLLEVQSNLHNTPVAATFIAPFSGVPVKIYAAEAGATKALPLATFLGLVVLSRALRHLLTLAVCHCIYVQCSRFLTGAQVRYMLLLAWGVFYLFYFNQHGVFGGEPTAALSDRLTSDRLRLELGS